MRFILRINKDLSLCVFGVFALSIFLKCILFHYICFNYIALSSLWNATKEFFAFYLAKLFPAFFIASFVFLTKRHKWTIVVSVIIDLYLIANIIYFRANDLFLNFETIAMVGNLNGFWSSITAYFNWKILLFAVLTGLYSFFIIKSSPSTNRFWLKFGLCHFFVILLIFYDSVLGYGSKKEKVFLSDFNMMQAALLIAKYQSPEDNLVRRSWVESATVFHYFPASLLCQVTKSYYSKNDKKNIFFTPTEEYHLEQLLAKQDSSLQPSTNLIVILVESLESWPLFLKDENETEITPSLNKLSLQNKTLFCNRIKSQVKYGTSGDGQMIINTGMLPIQSGTACMLYGENEYPNFAHWYNGFVINPAPNTWNQPIVSISYGYQETLLPKNKNGTADDAVINEISKGQLEKCKKDLFCIQEITASSHAPFTHVKVTSLEFSHDMPDILQNYLQSIHYADSCIGDFLDIIECDSLLENTTIVITGDHTIFKKSMLQEFLSFSEKYNYPIPSDESYCPLIIYSPKIKKRVEINDLCYQMDIFPTILHCIGADDYYWKGFGVNLLDSVARNNRRITEEEAYILSDKMIRSDWFRHNTNNTHKQ